MKRHIFMLLAIGMAFSTWAQKTLTVSKDGSGDYTTVQAAIDAVAEGETATIMVKAGTYEGMVKVGLRTKPSTKCISLIGEGMDKTIITAANGKNNIGNGKDVRDYATLAVFAPDFYAQDICIKNTGGKAAGQALALHVDGDRSTFYRCKITGYQDTHRTKKGVRSYYKECVIEGATDYIYSGGTCWFEHCTLNCVAGGYITAPEDITVYTTAEDGTKIWLGFIFNECTVTKASGVSDNSVLLGRCWGPDKCGSMFLNCQLNNIIKAAGWETMGGNDGTKSYYAEYKSKNGTALADVSKRISWSHQLTDADYQKVNTWAKVDAACCAINTSLTAFDPESVIEAHKTTDDYAPLEKKLLAFPTARGFGKYATGGRGGKVVEVTNLEDSGEGSLRWALTEAGKENATIVFRVSGIITIGPNPQKKTENSIRASLKNVTIAGQTAPGEGILLRGGKLNLGGSQNVIIRNLRSRLGNKGLEKNEGETDDAWRKRNFIEGGSIGIENAKNIIIDHCCFGWSAEENMTMYDNNYTTVQWCILHEGLYNAGHPKNTKRSYACQWGGAPATFHHNLLANNHNRSARINGASSTTQDRNVFLEYLNNVNFNWAKANSCYGGENEAGIYSSHECNFVGNYYKPGPARPASNSHYFIQIDDHRSDKTASETPSVWYFDGNFIEGTKNAEGNTDNWKLVNKAAHYALEDMKSDTWIYPSEKFTRLPASVIDDYDKYRTPVESAADAYKSVLAKAGTINRDAVEKRVIEDVTTGTPKYQTVASGGYGKGIIDTPFDAEGYPDYAPATPYVDNDHDGMADDWEVAHGFNPADPEDGKQVVSTEGYTALEVYLNSLMGEKIDFAPTAIRTVNMISSEVVHRQIFTLDGRQVGTLQRGLNIIRETMADGSTRIIKVMTK